MTASAGSVSFAADFAPATHQQWSGLVGATLAKSGLLSEEAMESPEDLLASVTAEGIRLAALYTGSDPPWQWAELGRPGTPPFRRGSASTGGWDVRQRHAGSDATLTRAAVLEDLEHGVTSLWLQLGPQAIEVAQLAVVLQDVMLDLAPVILDAGVETASAAREFVQLIGDRAVDPGRVRGNLGADPIACAVRGATQVDLSVLAEVARLGRAYPHLQCAVVDATVYHEAGGTDADELAIAAAVGVSYLRALTAAGLSIDEAFGRLEFRFAVTADQFGSIAKLRAARVMWNRIGQLSGASAAARAQRQHAVSSASMMTRRDPWVNMLRTTIACFAAAVAGARAITVAPFDAALGQPDDFARRIARNTHAVLHDESSLSRVLDPAGGSWFLESLTSQLAALAWTKFTDIERAGGAVTALTTGALAEQLSLSREQKLSDIAIRRDVITGVSAFADPAEVMLHRTPWPAVATGMLPTIRYAEEFEALRSRSDAHRERTGLRPTVFLGALGTRAAFASPLAYATELFALGGIDCVVATDAVGSAAARGSSTALVRAFAASKLTVVCLCSSAAVYVEQGPDLAEALRAAGAVAVWTVAEPPGDNGGDGENGVDGMLYRGCDVVAALHAVLAALEVQP